MSYYTEPGRVKVVLDLLNYAIKKNQNLTN